MRVPAELLDTFIYESWLDLFGNNWLTAVFFAATSGIAFQSVCSDQPPTPPQFDTILNVPAPRVAQYPPREKGQPASANTFAPPPVAAQGIPQLPRQLPSLPASGARPTTAIIPPARALPNAPPADASLATYRELGSLPLPQPRARLATVSPPSDTSLTSRMDVPNPTVPGTIFLPGQIIAWVGDQPIQVGDLMPLIEQAMASQLEKLSPEQRELHRDEIERQKQSYLKQALRGAIDTKLLYLDFLRNIPADKLKEALPKITAQAEKAFYEKQLPESLKKANVASSMELDAKLKEYGSSLEMQKQAFIERALGQSVLAEHIDYEPEVTHQEMLDYYRAHQEEFYREAKAQWEKLTVLFDRFPSKAEAWAAAANMGNEVLRGAPFEAVARRSSQDIDAQNGGFHDWTTKGSLVSEPLDQAIFSLEVGCLSQRIEDERGFHIIRVINRQEASVVPFVEAQVEIREKLRKQKIQQQGKAYLAKLRQEIPVWTIFDDQPGSAEQ